MKSTDPADYIIEKYENRSHVNPHTFAERYAWYRVREWVPEKKTYDVYDGFGTATAIRIMLIKHGVDADKVPLVDLIKGEIVVE